MRVLQVCAEIFPLLKTGGLADVAGALPAALHAAAGSSAGAGGVDVRVLLPGFAAILAGLHEPVVVAELPSRPGVTGARLLYGSLPACAGESGHPLMAYVIDAPTLYHRPGGPYSDAQGHGYADNHLRFALLGWVAARLADGIDRFWRAEVVHAHDWHAALAPVYLRAAEQSAKRRIAASVYTVHNLAYQGLFAAHQFAELDLPASFGQVDGMEFHGQISFMKAGLYFADHLTTVSPTYAREIQGPEQGCGLEGLLRLRSRSLSGILNGVDDAVWNPRTDKLLNHHFDARKLSGKARVKAALQQELGLATRADAPLLCVVSRLTEQKGLHLVQQALPKLHELGVQFAMLGNGDAAMEAAFRARAQAAPRVVAVRIGYDESFAHRLIAGSDVILVPSRFEPCGLTQLYGLKYGTLPLVRRVGGLADTVSDAQLETLDSSATGFVFDEFSADGLLEAMDRVLALWRRPKDWALLQKRAMAADCSWEPAARQYLDLYRRLTGGATV
jgi:starch synthase